MAAGPDPNSEWRGEAYRPAAGHHRAVDDWFIDGLPPDPNDLVVDLGSGTGEFTAVLADMVTGGRVIGVEPDSSMLATAGRITHPRLEFKRGSAQALDHVIEPGTVDKVLSRAVLHWIPVDEYPQVFAAAYRVLRPGGWFHSESAGAGNGPRMIALVDDLADQFGVERPPRFPDAALAFDVVENAGFEIPPGGVRTVAQRRQFDREQMESFLRTQVSVLLTRHADAGMSADIVEATVGGIERMRRSDGTFDQTFVRLEIIARRPE